MLAGPFSSHIVSAATGKHSQGWWGRRSQEAAGSRQSPPGGRLDVELVNRPGAGGGNAEDDLVRCQFDNGLSVSS
jgi:hypothetical protein